MHSATAVAATIWVRFAVPGFHQWPNAPMERGYLAHRHRHLFHVEVSTKVDHDDREIEFHDLLDHCNGLFPGGHLGSQSCEDMARDLATKLAAHYRRPFEVSVSEDGEMGATVTASP